MKVKRRAEEEEEGKGLEMRGGYGVKVQRGCEGSRRTETVVMDSTRPLGFLGVVWSSTVPAREMEGDGRGPWAAGGC